MSHDRSAWSRLAAVIDAISDRVGHAVAWLTLIMVLVTFLVVVLRHVFGIGYIWLQEVSVYLHALVFLLGAAYTLRADEHVRVDIFYRRMGARGQSWVNVVGTVALLLPSAAFIAWITWSYVLRSWLDAEASGQTGGLPYPFPSLLKTSIMVAMLLLALQASTWIMRHLAREHIERHDQDVGL